MKIVSYMEAYLTVAAAWDEVRPEAGAPYGIISAAIKQRYNFQIANPSLVSQQFGLATPNFNGGQFQFGSQTVVINHLEFQPNGIVVSSSKTEFSLKILEDVLSFLHSQYGFRIPPTDRKKGHRTAIVSDLGFGIEATFGKWLDVQSLLNAAPSADQPLLFPQSIRFLGRLNEQFVPDSQFLFERRIVAPQGENWIFSQGPIDTESHERLLERIESIFKS